MISPAELNQIHDYNEKLLIDKVVEEIDAQLCKPQLYK